MSDKYADERYNPTLRRCGSLQLKFDGKSLTMTGGKKAYEYRAVSGKPRPDGTFEYSQDRQRVRDAGPVPEGVYWVRPDELWENSWYKRGSTDAWGDYRLTIHPFTTTATFGRGGFFIHGGKYWGSAGCIDLTSGMNDFVKDLKAELGVGGPIQIAPKCQIHVEVKY